MASCLVADHEVTVTSHGIVGNKLQGYEILSE